MSMPLPIKVLAERKQSLGEEIANAITHGTGALLSVAALVLLVLAAAAKSDAQAVVAYSIFGTSLVILFTMSTIYHSLTPMGAKRVFEIIDHSSVFILIAGTYTVYCLSVLRGAAGWTLFGLIWGCAAIGVLFKALFIDKFPIAQTVAYVAMGWLVAPFLPALVAVLPGSALALLVAGGVAYTVGACIYSFKGIKWLHSVWHIFVLVGAGCHVASALFALG